MTYRNLMLTMVIGGLWHGASWAFIFWGFLHGMYLVIQRLITAPLSKIEQKLHFPKWFVSAYSIAIVYFFTCYAWIFFRAKDFATAQQVISKITSLEGFSWHTVLDKFLVIKAVILIAILLTAEIMNNNVKNLQTLAVENPVFRVAAFATLVMLVAFFGTFSASAFIYFQF